MEMGGSNRPNRLNACKRRVHMFDMGGPGKKCWNVGTQNRQFVKQKTTSFRLGVEVILSSFTFSLPHFTFSLSLIWRNHSHNHILHFSNSIFTTSIVSPTTTTVAHHHNSPPFIHCSLSFNFSLSLSEETNLQATDSLLMKQISRFLILIHFSHLQGWIF